MHQSSRGKSRIDRLIEKRERVEAERRQLETALVQLKSMLWFLEEEIAEELLQQATKK